MIGRFASTTLLALLATTASAAACSLSAENATPTAQLAYEPFAPHDELTDIRITVRNTGGGACQARVYAQPLGAPQLTGVGGLLAWRFGEGGAGPGGEYGPFSATVPGGGEQEITLRIEAPAGQVVPPGAYSGDVQLRIEDSDGAAVELSAPQSTIDAQVSGRALMSITGTYAGGGPGMAPASINFGAIENGEVGRVFVNVWSNTNVSVSLQSDNGGLMRHSENPALPPIAYTTTFDGDAVSLSSGATLLRSPPLSPAGASYELALTIVDANGRFAGVYQDVIIVTVNEN